MAIRATVTSNTTIVLRGAELPDLRAAGEALAKRLRTAIAINFQNQRTFGGELRPNSQAYTVRKILNGYSPLRGHRTGALQVVMERTRSWFISQRGGRAPSVTIRFTDSEIIARLPYVAYFAASKVVGGRIMGVRKSWQKDMNTFLSNFRPSGGSQRGSRNRGRQLAAAAALRAATRRNQQRTTVEVG